MLRSAVKARQTLTRLLVNVPAKLGGDNDFVPERGDAFPENFFDFKRAVGFSSVKERYPFIKCTVDNIDHLGTPGNGGVVFMTHVLHAQTDGRNFQLPEFTLARS